MTVSEAKKIGGRQGLIAVGLGLLIAQLIMVTIFSQGRGFLDAFFWFTTVEYKLNILIGAVIMLLSGYFYGQLTGKAILIGKCSFITAGFLGGMAVLLTTAFLAGWTGFIREGIGNLGTGDDPFEDYIFKPLIWIISAGTIPALVIGLWFGARIKAKGKRLEGIAALPDDSL